MIHVTLRSAVIALIAGTCFPQYSAAATFDRQIVALSGDLAPDGNGTFVSFDEPILNESGQVLFGAVLAGTSGGSNDNAGLFRGNETNVVQIVRKGQAVPNGNGTFNRFGLPYTLAALNNSGQVAFPAHLAGTTGGTSDNQGIYIGDGVTLVQVVRNGQIAPDGNGTFNDLPPNLNLNDSGQVAFRAYLTGTANSWHDDNGIFRGDGTSLTQLVRAGETAPDGNGVFFAFEQFFQFNNSGTAAYWAGLYGTQGGDSDNEGIFRSDGGVVLQIARNGQIVHDGHGALSLGALTQAEYSLINNAGQVIFIGSESDIEGSSIIRSDGVTLTHMVTTGKVAPDGNGKLHFFHSPVFNDAGQVASKGYLQQTNGGFTDTVGIFRCEGTSLMQLARAGQIEPTGNGRFSAFGDPVQFNDLGQVAFIASLTGTSGGSFDNHGVFLFDDHLGLVPIVRKGDTYLGSTISGLKFYAAVPPANSMDSLNDAGQVVYQFSLADGRSGIAIATLVPEPASWTLTALAILMSAVLQRRRANLSS